MLILQRCYNLSDDETEFVIMDRLSFMHFLGLNLSDRVPDTKTIWNFKNQLAQAWMVEKLFKKLDNQLDNDGIIVHQGKMIDTSVESSNKDAKGTLNIFEIEIYKNNT
ncbi:MAG: transposase [Acidobacterium ailaaui]|nr:transposase [Pseudacidobacterium ailaaui]